MHKPLSPMSHRAHIGLRFTETPPEGGGAPPQGGAGGTTPPATPPAEKTFTQAELNAIATREKNEGKAAAERAIAEQLGVPIDEAKQIIADRKKAAEDAKTETQKDRDAAAAEKDAAAKDREAAKVEIHQARLERAFDKVGVDLGDEKLKDKNARLLRLVTAEPGSSYDDVLAEVKQIEKDFPGLFSTGDGKTPTRRAPGSDPQGTPPPPSPGEDMFEQGRKRAQALRGSSDEKNPLVLASQRRSS